MQFKTLSKQPAWRIATLLAFALPAIAFPVCAIAGNAWLASADLALPCEAAPPDAATIAPAVTATASSAGFGMPLEIMQLDDQRGGSDLGTPVPLGGAIAAGTVSNNRAVDVITGSNAIRDGAFAHASGLPVVIQNTGANVLIQSATVVNVQLR